MKHNNALILLGIIIVWIVACCVMPGHLSCEITAHAAPTTQQTSWMQAIVDSPRAKQLDLRRISGTFGTDTVTALPTPLTPWSPDELPNTVHVGPTRLTRDLKGIKDGYDYILDAGRYDIEAIDIHKGLSIRSADVSDQAVIRFPGCWDTKRPAGPDPLSPRREGTIHVYAGTVHIHDVQVVGGEDVIVLGSDPAANIDANNVTLDGGGIWRGNGGNRVYIHAQSTGRPRGYFAACFTNPVSDVTLDFTGMLPVQQGGVHLPGGDQGDAAVRICNAKQCEILGLKTVSWIGRDGKPWKQDLQLRPKSGLFVLQDCELREPDIGDIRAHYAAPRTVNQVTFNDCKLIHEPHYTPGARTVNFNNTIVGGLVWNKTVNK